MRQFEQRLASNPMIINSKELHARAVASGKILADVLYKLGKMTKPGVSSVEIDTAARTLIAKAGATPVFLHYQPEGEKRPYPAAICLSVNDMVVHGIPNEEPFTIEDGDIVSIDCGVLYDGIVTDATLTVIAGKARKEDKALLSAAEEALALAAKMAKTGTRVGDISNAIGQVAKKHGFGVPVELGGHGVGLYLHEDPFIGNTGSKGTGPMLKEGEMIAIEPIFTAGHPTLRFDNKKGYECRTRDGSRAVQVEHTIIVGKKEGEIVTKR